MNATETVTEPTWTRVENATLYRGGAFGYSRTECRWIEWVVKPYAQYTAATHVKFVEKGKRTARGFVRCGIDSPFIILKGHGHPKDLVEVWKDVPTNDPNFTARQTRHSCFSNEWDKEFNAALAAYLDKNPTGVFLTALQDTKAVDERIAAREEG